VTPDLGQPRPDEQQALTQLAQLVDLGWTFGPAGRSDDGEPVPLIGTRAWPGGWTDAISIRSITDARAWRSTPDDSPGVVWELTGGVESLVRELLDLPAPDQPGAPRLVKAPAPRLWTPPRRHP
jgi:hypothetical protein